MAEHSTKRSKDDFKNEEGDGITIDVDALTKDKSNLSTIIKELMEEKVKGSYKKGGKIHATGIYRLHKGERVLNPKQTKTMEKALENKKETKKEYYKRHWADLNKYETN